MSSLAFMTQKFLGKTMCKYEQRSNWNRRPLKQTQLTYAAIDARVCTSILTQMLGEKKLSMPEAIALEKEGGEKLVDQATKKSQQEISKP